MIEKSIGAFRLSLDFEERFLAAQVLNREARIFRSFSLRLPRGLEKNKTFLTLTLNVRGFNPVNVSLSIQDNAESIARCEAKALADARLPEGLTPGQHYDATLKLSHENGFDEIPFATANGDELLADILDAGIYGSSLDGSRCPIGRV